MTLKLSEKISQVLKVGAVLRLKLIQSFAQKTSYIYHWVIFVPGAPIDMGNCSMLAIVSLETTYLNLHRCVVFLSNLLLLVVPRSVVADNNITELSSDF